jgi:kynurenine formamidase
MSNSEVVSWQGGKTILGAPARFGPANVLRGLGASRTGEVISLNLELGDPIAPFGRSPFRRTMRLHNQIRPFGEGDHLVINDDEIQLALQGSSQWDSYAHFGLITDDGSEMYFGGFGLEETFPEPSAPNIGIHALGPGIVTRGVLLDIVALQGEGQGYLAGEFIIDRDCIERCLKRQAIEIEPGDAVFIYTGFENRREILDGLYPPDASGVDGSTVPLWEELEILALISDNPGVEIIPTDHSVHIGLLRNLGVPLGELWALRELAAACRNDARYDFLLVSVPLNIRGAFGSTANAVAIR